MLFTFLKVIDFCFYHGDLCKRTVLAVQLCSPSNITTSFHILRILQLSYELAIVKRCQLGSICHSSMPLVHFESGGYSHYGLTLSHCNIVTLHSHCPIGLKVLPYFFSYQISLPNFLAFLRTCHCQPKLTWRRLSFVSVFVPL